MKRQGYINGKWMGRASAVLILLLPSLPVLAQSASPLLPHAKQLPGEPANSSSPDRTAPAGAVPPAAQTPAAAQSVGAGLHSLFFTPDEINLLMQASIAYDQFQANTTNNAKNQAKDFLNRLEDPQKRMFQQPEKSYEYPQFFLASILYHTPTDWFIQINGEKFSPDSWSNPQLKLLAMDAEQVVLEWTPASMQHVNESWAKYANETAAMNQAAGTVTFTLRPNQTFSSYLMRVVEGKLPVVKIEAPSDKKDKTENK